MDIAWALLRDIRTQTFTSLWMRTSDVKLRFDVGFCISFHAIIHNLCLDLRVENKSLENAQNSLGVELDSVNLPNFVFNVMFSS